MPLQPGDGLSSSNDSVRASPGNIIKLQLRQSLQASFEGCDIYTPRKPKGLASKALEEWRKHYPNSEETNKTIGKQANFCRSSQFCSEII